MLIAEADFPFLEFLWAMIVFFAWVAWIWIVITVFIDLFAATTSAAGARPDGWCS